MYKLLIVDDKADERQNLRNLISWEDNDIEIVGEANNGHEGIMMANDLLPDIIITDIVMPKMDGLVMSQRIFETLPQIRIILASCYDEFRYAQYAIRYGVSDYILKPIIANELEIVIKRIVSSLNESEQCTDPSIDMDEIVHNNIIELQQIFIEELVKGNYTDECAIQQKLTAYRLDHMKKSKYYMMNIELEDKTICVNLNQITEIIDNIHPSAGNYVFGDNQRIYVVIGNNHGEIDYNGLPYRLRDDIKNIVHSDITIGISEPREKLVEINQCYEEARQAVLSKFYFGRNRIIFFSELSTIPYSLVEVDIKDVYERIKKMLFSPDKDEIEVFCDEIVSACIKKNRFYIRTIMIHVVNCCQMVLISFGKSFTDVFNDEIGVYEKLLKIETIPDIKQWLNNILLFINEYLVEKNNRRIIKVVEEMKDIISKKYSDKLTMEDIASQVHFHPVYAGTIFKQVTGKTFLQYLIEYRIQKAMELLQSTDFKVFEISEMVGYWNRSYFTLAFKEYAGMTPKEYRDKFSRSGNEND